MENLKSFILQPESLEEISRQHKNTVAEDIAEKHKRVCVKKVDELFFRIVGTRDLEEIQKYIDSGRLVNLQEAMRVFSGCANELCVYANTGIQCEDCNFREEIEREGEFEFDGELYCIKYSENVEPLMGEVCFRDTVIYSENINSLK